jgi:hypothetical protein
MRALAAGHAGPASAGKAVALARGGQAPPAAAALHGGALGVSGTSCVC